MCFNNFVNRIMDIIIVIILIIISIMLLLDANIIKFEYSYEDKQMIQKVSQYIEEEDREVILGGQNLFVESGIKGLQITNIFREDTNLQVGDIITKVNNIEIETIKQMSDLVQKIGNSIFDLTVKRGDIVFRTSIGLIKMDDNSYNIGFTLTNNETIFTMTFYDESEKRFAGAGHEFLVNKEKPKICMFSFNDVQKSKIGEIGKLKGNNTRKIIGNIDLVNSTGAYGSINNSDSLFDNKVKVKIGTIEEVKRGKASIFCSIDGNKVKEYEVNISFQNILGDRKHFIVEFTDSKLIEKTGGGVSGMSGSPIVQNGKIIGALATVHIDNPTKGEAIFIDYMIASMYKIY